jgi:hypothetical protein
MDTKDYIYWTLALAQVAYAAAAYHRGQITWMSRPFVVMLSFTLLTWGAVGYDVYTRPGLPPAVLVNYGIDGPNQFHGIAQLTHWENYKTSKAVLITRTVYGDRDRLSDDWIAKSIPYTIEGPIVSTIAITNNQMRFALGMTNFVEYNFAVLPADIS